MLDCVLPASESHRGERSPRSIGLKDSLRRAVKRSGKVWRINGHQSVSKQEKDAGLLNTMQETPCVS